MPELTKEQILAAVTSQFFDDLPFIEKLNNITYSQKMFLKREQHKTNQQQNGSR